MWHHQNTAFILRVTDMPRWFLSIERKGAFTPPSVLLLVAGGGRSAASTGSR